MDQQPDNLKHCPICNQDLPVGSFGVNRFRKDGTNAYCLICIRDKARHRRANLKEYKTTHERALKNRYWEQLTAAPIQIESGDPATRRSSVERVRELIQQRPRTQRELRSETKLSVEVIGEALAVLNPKSYWCGDERIYFIPKQEPQIEVSRKPMALGNWHTVREVMPERKRA